MFGAVKEVLAPVRIAATEIAHDLSIDVKAEGLWMLEQPHSSFVGKRTTLAVIASFATGDKVIPVGVSTL